MSQPWRIIHIEGSGELDFEVRESFTVASVESFQTFQFGFPRRGSDGGIATRADGIDRSIRIHPVGKLHALRK
jgi:hypothetical protein